MVAPAVTATAQSLYSGTVWGLGLGVALLAAGWLYRDLGGQAFLVMAAVGLAGAYATVPHVARRIKRFLDPASGDTFQVDVAVESFMRGGWFGRGPGEGTVKRILPDSHTDFVFAILGEELGYLGVLVVLALQLALVIKALQIGRKALSEQKQFEGYVGCGIGIWFGFQTVINVGAAAGMLPTKGLTLPLVSYGGSSLIAMSIAVALLLRIDFEMRRDSRQALQKGTV